MTRYLLDTHAWLWLIQEAHDEVTPGFFAEAEEWQRNGQLNLSPISCWELGLLTATSRLTLDRTVEDLWHRATEPDACRIAELTGLILLESTRLPGSLHKDPADRILASTARAYDLTLVTRDKPLLNYAKLGYMQARKP